MSPHFCGRFAAIAMVTSQFHYSRAASNREGKMSDIVILASRILMSAVFVVYGSLKFMDVSSIINNPGTKRFMDLVASGAAAPTWLGYVIAAIELFGGLAILIGFMTRPVAYAFVVYLIFVVYFAHNFWDMQ